MPETDKLFPEYQLLSWLRDETFFSWLAVTTSFGGMSHLRNPAN